MIGEKVTLVDSQILRFVCRRRSGSPVVAVRASIGQKIIVVKTAGGQNNAFAVVGFRCNHKTSGVTVSAYD